MRVHAFSTPIARSAIPFILGVFGGEDVIRIPSFSAKSLRAPRINSPALSVWILWTLCLNDLCICCMRATIEGPASPFVLVGIKDVCLLPVSTRTVAYLLPCTSRGRGPVVSVQTLESGSYSVLGLLDNVGQIIRKNKGYRHMDYLEHYRAVKAGVDF